MGIGPLGTKVVPYFMETLEVYLGNLVPLPYLLQVVDLINKFLEDFIADFPVEGENDRFETS